MPLRHAARTRTGQFHAYNEDSYAADSDFGIYIVADGVGGTPEGRLASRLVVNTVVSVYRHFPPSGIEQSERRLHGAIRLAHQRLRAAALARGHESIATTAVILACHGEHAVIGHVGDSRAYLLRDGDCRRLTRDHSYAQEAIDRMALSEEQARDLPFANVISRAVGSREAVAMDTQRVALSDGDLLLLCTDGLCGSLSDEALGRVLSAHRDQLDRAPEKLVSEAIRNGSTDDVTALIVECGPNLRWSEMRLPGKAR